MSARGAGEEVAGRRELREPRGGRGSLGSSLAFGNIFSVVW